MMKVDLKVSNVNNRKKKKERDYKCKQNQKQNKKQFLYVRKYNQFEIMENKKMASHSTNFCYRAIKKTKARATLSWLFIHISKIPRNFIIKTNGGV